MPQKKKKKKQQVRTEYFERIGSDEMKYILADRLTSAELHSLNSMIRNIVVEEARSVGKAATEEAYKRQFAVMFRVLRDRYGFGRKRLREMWDTCLEYIHDIDEGKLTTNDMLDTLKYEDGILIDWHVQL